MDAKFRSRKFFIALLLFGVSTALLVGGYISETIWRDISIAVAGGYLLANAYQNTRSGHAESD